jgi:hypothetical protein
MVVEKNKNIEKRKMERTESIIMVYQRRVVGEMKSD